MHASAQAWQCAYPSLKTKAATALLAPARMSASSSMMVPLTKVTRLSMSGASSTSTTYEKKKQ